MNILKVFGISVLATPTLILIMSIIMNSWMPLISVVMLTIICALPNFIGITLLRGMYKVLKVVWR